MSHEIRARAEAIAADRDRGAGELALDLLPVLDEALAQDPSAVIEVARIVCRGQPAMAPLWHACAAAVREADEPGSFVRVRAEMARAPAALARAAGLALRDLLQGTAAPRLLTLSFSSGVLNALVELSRESKLRVICGEGRPRFEGRRLATSLAALGIDVTLTPDAALTSFLTETDAVVVGADAIGETHWINKTGTFGLAAAAAHTGVPFYVVASRDKVMPAERTGQGPLPVAPADEVWAGPPERVSIANRSFEPTPIGLATLFLTDAGPIAPEDVPELVRRRSAAVPRFLSLLG